MIVYKKDTGEILNKLPDNQSISSYYHHHPKDYVDNLDFILVENPPFKLSNYIVVNGGLVKKEMNIMDIQMKYSVNDVSNDMSLLERINILEDKIKELEVLNGL